MNRRLIRDVFKSAVPQKMFEDVEAIRSELYESLEYIEKELKSEELLHSPWHCAILDAHNAIAILDGLERDVEDSYTIEPTSKGVLVVLKGILSPASTKYHHAYIGGWIAHVREMMDIAHSFIFDTTIADGIKKNLRQDSEYHTPCGFYDHVLFVYSIIYSLIHDMHKINCEYAIEVLGADNSIRLVEQIDAIAHFSNPHQMGGTEKYSLVNMKNFEPRYTTHTYTNFMLWEHSSYSMKCRDSLLPEFVYNALLADEGGWNKNPPPNVCAFGRMMYSIDELSANVVDASHHSRIGTAERIHNIVPRIYV